MPPARVSILLPAWNAAATIGAALASIRGQTELSWECVVVDDGSTDQTAAIVCEESTRDSLIRLIQTPHRGLIAALNEGLAHCAAPYIARMDADDVMHRDRLHAQLQMLDADQSLAGIGAHVRIVPRYTMSPRLREYETWLNGMRSAEDVTRDAFVECPVAHPTWMLRRDLAALPYVDRGWPEDYDLFLRTLAAGGRFGVVPRRLLCWRDRSDGATRTDPRYSLAQFTACKAHYLAHGFLARGTSYVLWGYGDTGRLLRRALALHGKTPSHVLEVKASRIGQRIHGTPVVPLTALPSLRGRPIVVSVARAGPRAEIRQVLAAAGFVEGIDFVCAA